MPGNAQVGGRVKVKSPRATREESRWGRQNQDPSTGSVGGWGQPVTGRREVAGTLRGAVRRNGQLLISVDSEWAA
ncbi:hypothetical protein NDU88_002388 [Pleurodeles waltl]|uniref:Uncharacterized protein n=1 Tax=Pleurodeles waltl TaxID=8319 RepID=A0AAV7RAT1_PLEWA|nr:hypothetical protein NDU88_002388 [Pleurodeles waltl]